MKQVYTVRFCHLEERPKLMVGSIVKSGDKIGTMGASGPPGTERHVHGDCVKGRQSGEYSLADIEAGNPAPAPRQMNWFIDKDLFRTEIFITAYYADVEYQLKRKKVHLGYDVVPMDRHKTKAHYGIYWNRSVDGIVTAVRFDPKGYGHYIMIAFEVEEED